MKLVKNTQILIFSKIDGKFVAPFGPICEKLGLNFVFQNLKNGISGYFDDKTKTIFINEKYSATRNLFTIAYELGALCVT